VQNNDPLQELVIAFIKSLDKQELLNKMDENGVPIAPILSIKDIFEDLQLENILEVDHPRLGKVKVPGIVPKFSETPGRILFDKKCIIYKDNRNETSK